MSVEPGPVPRLQVDEDEAHVGVAELVALQLRIRQLVALDDHVAGRVRCLGSLLHLDSIVLESAHADLMEFGVAAYASTTPSA